MVMPIPVHSPPPESGKWTIEDLRRLPDDGNRYEIIGGELLVTPAPSGLHQRAVLELALALRDHFGANAPLEIRIAPSDVIFSGPTLVQPDLVVIPAMSGEEARRRSDTGPPLLAVEVLSPRTARVDRIAKREMYRTEAVPEYWIVDLDARIVERWTPDDDRPEVLDDVLAWQAEGIPPLQLRLPELFARIWRD